MKKMLSILLLGGALLGATLAPALAENPRYRLYDPQTKKTIYAPMMTIGGSTENGYRIAFLDRARNMPCVVDSSYSNRNSQGLLGGKCLLMNGDRFISWRELSAGSYYSEVRAVEIERKQEGMYLEKFSTR